MPGITRHYDQNVIGHPRITIRSNTLSGVACSLTRDSFEVNAASLSTPGLLTTSTRSTKFSAGIHIALRDFIPPLLLSGTPDFLRAAALARERHILVVATRDKARSPIAVVRRESLNVYADEARRGRRIAAHIAPGLS